MGTIIQFHGVIIENEEVITIRTLKNNISKKRASILLSDLEEKFRKLSFDSNIKLTLKYRNGD